MVIDDRPVVAYPGQLRMPVIDERVQTDGPPKNGGR
jgi:hypothetical protein